MKKIFAALAATAIMAFSVVPAFAAVDSPVATTAPVNPTPVNPSPGSPSKDNTPIAPKTGYSDAAVYSVIAVSLAVCGAATATLVKSRKK